MLVVLLLIARSLLAGLGSRRELMLENLALRHQLQVALRTNPHPRLQPRDRVLWVWLYAVWPDGWRQHLHLVRAETVLRWHRKGWRLYWTWKSRTKLGRPHLSAEVRTLIARMSRENPLWGSERIRGELLKLGIVVSNRSIRRYRWRRVRPTDHQRWRTFLSNQLRGVWAADLYVVQTVSYRILYVFFLLRHDRREWMHFNVTASPTAAWIWRQVLEATTLGRQPKFLIHDRDADYGRDFDERLANLGITGVRTPPRAPKANAIGERIVRTIRSECLDHIIVINERHLQAVLAEFADYYNRDRPHRSLELASPIVVPSQPAGRVVSRSVLGGLHHVYARAA
jgi:transposase InsO family protein